MARPLRIEFPGAVYHVTSRGNERRPFVRDDEDREMFVQILGRVVLKFGLALYAEHFNRRHRRVGHLFQGRYKAFLVDSDTYFREVARYVVLNPVRAGMCEAAGGYKWSSYRARRGSRPRSIVRMCTHARWPRTSRPRSPMACHNGGAWWPRRSFSIETPLLRDQRCDHEGDD